MFFFTWLGVAVVFLLGWLCLPRVTATVLLGTVLRSSGYMVFSVPPVSEDVALASGLLVSSAIIGFVMDAKMLAATVDG